MSTVERILGTTDTRDVLESVLGSLPNIYHIFSDIMYIEYALAAELATSGNQDNDILDQKFVTTATWGLDYWERLLGLKSKPTMTYEQRRSVVLAVLKSYSTITKDNLKSIVKAFTGEDVTINENYSTYSIEVYFTGTFGVPTDFESCTKVVRRVVPAHLNITYKFLYTNWSEINKTWATIDGLNLTYDLVDKGGLK